MLITRKGWDGFPRNIPGWLRMRNLRKSKKRGRRENKAGSEDHPNLTVLLRKSGEGTRSSEQTQPGQGTQLGEHSRLDFTLHSPPPPALIVL